MDGWMDGWMDKQTEMQTELQTDRETNRHTDAWLSDLQYLRRQTLVILFLNFATAYRLINSNKHFLPPRVGTHTPDATVSQPKAP